MHMMNPVWVWKHSFYPPWPGRCQLPLLRSSWCQLFPLLLFLCCCVNKRLAPNCIFRGHDHNVSVRRCTQTQRSALSGLTSTQNSTTVVWMQLCTYSRSGSAFGLAFLVLQRQPSELMPGYNLRWFTIIWHMISSADGQSHFNLGHG